ncbi:stress-response A/B barrel domain-containing protein At5g22580-like [Triticum aestivum]|uniref:stress-response A/B barrel domain-containing protein At5g22580-like n=1 Tax=Triticum aestivum TaxID=4565 RepID=UPI001D0092D6|nr:stress-response A/B barrel domain-containing protein At5g22580-like [Triticum aestivum]
MEFKHLCLVRFKEGVVVDDIIEELTKLAGELDTVKIFGWGKGALNQEALTHGFTHVFSMSFTSADDLVACMGHEKHSAFACHAGHTDNSEAVFGSSSSSSRRP